MLLFMVPFCLILLVGTGMDSALLVHIWSELMEGRQIEDLVGQKFGRWTVLRYLGLQSRQAHWLRRCDCGTEKSVAGRSLTGCGKTRSGDAGVLPEASNTDL